MRDITFRAWQGGRFHYWGFIKSKYGDDYEFHAIADTNAEPLSMSEKMKRSQQYTGLKDKNGKEIYEGDIVKARNGSSPVIWEQKQCQWVFPEKSGLEYVPLYWAATHEREVIGNIYENKELLK